VDVFKYVRIGRDETMDISSIGIVLDALLLRTILSLNSDEEFIFDVTGELQLFSLSIIVVIGSQFV
jgi:hypothetical protein